MCGIDDDSVVDACWWDTGDLACSTQQDRFIVFNQCEHLLGLEMFDRSHILFLELSCNSYIVDDGPLGVSEFIEAVTSCGDPTYPKFVHYFEKVYAIATTAVGIGDV